MSTIGIQPIHRWVLLTKKPSASGMWVVGSMLGSPEISREEWSHEIHLAEISDVAARRFVG